MSLPHSSANDPEFWELYRWYSIDEETPEQFWDWYYQGRSEDLLAQSRRIVPKEHKYLHPAG